MADFPTRIARVTLRCSDVEASAESYAGLVGLEIASLGAEEARLCSPGGDEPCLVLRRAERPGQAPRRASGLFHTAFRYPTRAGLAAALQRIGELDARFSGAADHGVSEALYLDDPDGLGIELYRDRPRDEWPAAGPGERVRMFTAPLDLKDLASSAAAAEESERGLPGAGVDVGHVHLKVADTAAAERFWTESIGLDLMTRFGGDAIFLARDGYHHHVGANSWQSRGAEREPLSGPGLDEVALYADSPTPTAVTPDGIPVATIVA